MCVCVCVDTTAAIHINKLASLNLRLRSRATLDTRGFCLHITISEEDKRPPIRALLLRLQHTRLAR